jgi:hypothetical protein
VCADGQTHQVLSNRELLGIADGRLKFRRLLIISF